MYNAFEKKNIDIKGYRVIFYEFTIFLEGKVLKGKKIFILIIILIIICISIFLIFNNKTVKKSKVGNNSSSQEIVDYVLNISSYTATIEVDVKSNKNENKYILKQEYISPNKNSQEVIEPSNIAGIKIIKDENSLKLENSKLNLTSVLEKYEYISDNCLDLNCFIDDYKNDNNAQFNEENNQIIMQTKLKKLYIDRETALPVKMEVKGTNKNTAIYILYNEVNVNS